jgi:hypothetical protein
VVTDAGGEPLAGLYVTVEANTPDTWDREAGTVTDSRGRFRLRCQIDAEGNVPWSGVFISAFPVSGKVPAGLPDAAWKRIAPECGLADDPDIHVVLAGFLRRQIPLLARRLITLVPAVVVVAAGVDPTRALVLSQVLLSFGIPFALWPLVLLSRRRDVMGSFVNRRRTTAAAMVTAAAVTVLNAVLVASVITA